MSAKALMVFDFDHTLLDANSDVEIQKLLPDGKLTPALKIMSKEAEWNDFIRQVLVHLHEIKVSEETLVQFLREMPLTPGVPEMLARLKELGCDIIIISDANHVFINEPLKAAGLNHLIKTVFTNPASFNDDGLLSLQPFSCQTECNLCRRNMCKGSILKKYLSESSTQYSFVGYVGDGPNDFCPMLKLTSSDLAFPRKGYNIERVIQDKLSQKLVIQAEVISWESVGTITDAVEKRLSSNV